MIFVDSNVLIDIISGDAQWRDWSAAKVLTLNDSGEILVVNHIVVAEISANFPNDAALVASLDALDIEIMPLSDAVAFLAGTAFRRYRRSQVGRDGILADFLIGAHAVQLGARLLTRDPRLYRYFPDLSLLTPETDHD